MKKTLYILRHAKTEPLASGQEDHERRLAPRGQKDAARLSDYLAEKNIRPDKILYSTATRVKETLAPLGLLEAHGEMLDKLYLASSNELLSMIAETPESAHSLMLIGHNPGLHELCLKLAKDGDSAARTRLTTSFPTCAMATITINGTWQDIAHAPVKLADFITPKMF
jgi:phosphohistidine phosphatase